MKNLEKSGKSKTTEKNAAKPMLGCHFAGDGDVHTLSVRAWELFKRNAHRFIVVCVDPN